MDTCNIVLLSHLLPCLSTPILFKLLLQLSLGPGQQVLGVLYLCPQSAQLLVLHLEPARRGGCGQGYGGVCGQECATELVENITQNN